MSHEEARVEVEEIRRQVVAIVGICGQGTHPLTELIHKLERGEGDADEAVEEAKRIRHSLPDFR